MGHGCSKPQEAFVEKPLGDETDELFDESEGTVLPSRVPQKEGKKEKKLKYSNGTACLPAANLCPATISVSTTSDSSSDDNLLEKQRGAAAPTTQLAVPLRPLSMLKKIAQGSGLATIHSQRTFVVEHSTSPISSATEEEKISVANILSDEKYKLPFQIPVTTRKALQMKSFYESDFEDSANKCMEKLKLRYSLDQPLSKRDKVMVMQGWNKVLAFQTAFEEAFFMKWRLLVAEDEIRNTLEERHSMDEQGRGIDPTAMSLESEELMEIHWNAIDQVETNQDPIALSLGTRLYDTPLCAVIDGAVRELCPHTQAVAREAYRPLNDSVSNHAPASMNLECKSLPDYFKLYARCGICPQHWVLFCNAFMWALKTHAPYADENDSDEMSLPRGSFARYVAAHVALPAIEASLKLRRDFRTPLFATGVLRFWRRINAGSKDQSLLGETFYQALLTNHPVLLDYFAKADMDSLAIHLMAGLDLCVKSINGIGEARTTFRGILDGIGERFRELGIPTFAYALVGAQLLDCLKPLFKQEEEIMMDDDLSFSAGELESAFAAIYGEVMYFTYHPMLREEKLCALADEFFADVAEELGWSPGRLSKRMLEVKLDIACSGTYSHTEEELEIGARLAWRNSSKCVGRISWNTLLVRDCRHAEQPEEIFHEVQEHLKIATGGCNIQSVMTIFKPREKQTWGTRFWSSQFVRYAGYKDSTGKILGDPANADLTGYLLHRKLWRPPKQRSGFDILPLVLKMPGEEEPHIFELPPECVHEVHIEHPACPAIGKLGQKWTTVPAISNFNMNLGGVDYQCAPFNGWFVSTEVVRNLLERYQVGEQWADLLCIDRTDDMWENQIAIEVDKAVLHSFRKSQYTVVDPVSVGKSFCTHVVREREQFGRECPAQWSWIGGYLGHTNPTWHLEMRDCVVGGSAYEYSSEALLLMDDSHIQARPGPMRRLSQVSSAFSDTQITGTPKVLILYGSETGNAEAIALRLARSLSLLRPVVKCLNDAAGLEIVYEMQITHVFAICSTFGKGEAPQNADIFFQTNICPGTLSNTFSAVLALGSTLYPDYCRSGILLDEKLKKAGRKQLVPIEKADAAAGDESTIFNWSSLVTRLVLPPSTEKRLKAELVPIANAPPVEHSVHWIPAKEKWQLLPEVFQWSEAISSVCISNEELLENGDVNARSTRRIVFGVQVTSTYETGDHLCVSPLNSLVMVRRFARYFEKELLEASMANRNCPLDLASIEMSDAALMWQLKQQFRVDCKEFGRESQPRVPFKTPATLLEILQADVDLALHPSGVPDLVSMLNRRLGVVDRDELAQDPIFQQYCGLIDPIVKGSDDEKHQATNDLTDRFPTIMDFLEEFRSLFGGESVSHGRSAPGVSLGDVLALLPRLQPRYYSISSSSHTSPSEIAITVSVLHKQTSAGIMVNGICSNYLARLRPGTDRVKIAVRKSTFRSPSDVKAPVIMIGPGTGLAPMMGFLEDRYQALMEAQSEENDKEDCHALQCHLFFGCRSQADRIYREQLESYERDGVINFHLALSRERPSQYVQDKLREMEVSLCELLLNEQTHYYICGDAKMADDCYEVCVETLRKHNSMSRVSAVQHLKRMRAEERWQMDLWGLVHQFKESRDAVAKMKKKAAEVWLSRFVEGG